MTGRRSHGRLSALNGVVHQGSGAMAWSSSIRFTVLRLISWPRLAKAPRRRGVATPRILNGHAHDQLGHCVRRQRPTAATTRSTVVLVGNQSPIPAEDGVRRDDAGHLRQDPAPEFPTADGETTPLGVCRSKWATTELLARTPTFGDVSASADCSASTIERPREWSAD